MPRPRASRQPRPPFRKQRGWPGLGECEGDTLGVRALHVALKLISLALTLLLLLLRLLVGKLHEKYVNDQKYVPGLGNGARASYHSKVSQNAVNCQQSCHEENKNFSAKMLSI